MINKNNRNISFKAAAFPQIQWISQPNSTQMWYSRKVKNFIVCCDKVTKSYNLQKSNQKVIKNVKKKPTEETHKKYKNQMHRDAPAATE